MAEIKSTYGDLLKKTMDFVFGKKDPKKDSLGLGKSTGASKSKQADIDALEKEYENEKGK